MCRIFRQTLGFMDLSGITSPLYFSHLCMCVCVLTALYFIIFLHAIANSLELYAAACVCMELILKFIFRKQIIFRLDIPWNLTIFLMFRARSKLAHIGYVLISEHKWICQVVIVSKLHLELPFPHSRNKYLLDITFYEVIHPLNEKQLSFWDIFYCCSLCTKIPIASILSNTNLNALKKWELKNGRRGLGYNLVLEQLCAYSMCKALDAVPTVHWFKKWKIGHGSRCTELDTVVCLIVSRCIKRTISKNLELVTSSQVW